MHIDGTVIIEQPARLIDKLLTHIRCYVRIDSPQSPTNPCGRVPCNSGSTQTATCGCRLGPNACQCKPVPCDFMHGKALSLEVFVV